MPIRRFQNSLFSQVKEYGVLSGKTIVTTTQYTELYAPAGTTRVFGINTFSGTAFVAPGSSYTMTKYGNPTISTSGGPNSSMGVISGLTQPTSTSSTSGAIGWIIDAFPVMNNVQYCFVAWYKGTQSQTQTTWGVGNPIFGDYRSAIYTSLGLQGGKIGVGDNALRQGSTFINDNTWRMLAWNWKSGNLVDGYINGILDMSNMDINDSPINNRVDCIGFTYAFGANVVSPTQIAGLQIFSGNLTATQLLEIYTKTINGTQSSNIIYD